MKTNQSLCNSFLRAFLVPTLAFCFLEVSLSGAEPGKAQPPAKKADAPAGDPQAEIKAGKAPSASVSRKVLIFRNVRSWKRKIDFEEALTNAGFKFDVKP